MAINITNTDLIKKGKLKNTDKWLILGLFT
jgi:hypothetical protein